MRDVAAGTTVLAAQNTAGVQANGTTERSAISADGRAVVFEAPAGTINLAPNDTDTGQRRHRAQPRRGDHYAGERPHRRRPARASPTSPATGATWCSRPSQKYDATNDASGGNDVYRRDMTTGRVRARSRRGTALDTAAPPDGIRPAISADGSRVSFTSTSADLTAADTNAAWPTSTRATSAPRITVRASLASDGTDAERRRPASDRPSAAPGAWSRS